MDLRRLHLLAAASVIGCAGRDAASPPDIDTSSPTGDAQRAIAEADIVQLDQGRLYAMSRSGSVSVIDAATPGQLALLGQIRLPGEPFEMYRRGTFLVTMSNNAVTSGGEVRTQYGPSATDPDAGALVNVLDVSDPTNIIASRAFKVPGEIADSRIVGDVLYLATYENAACFECGPAPRTMVTTFDVSNPIELRQVDQRTFQSNAPDGYNLPWGSHWKRSIFVTDARLYIGGHADIDPSTYESGPEEGIIDVLDITDPAGRLGDGARITVAGAILSRWQLDDRDGILRVVSQKGAGRTGNGLASPKVETFAIESTQTFAPLGDTMLDLPSEEGLRTVRFDGARAYAITYNQTDPLFVIDLADPANPRQRGELHMPGFMFYLEPHGDRVIGLGIDRADPGGSLNVSLFDVSDADRPTMIRRVPFGIANISEDYAILNGEVSEDQDRIQKAFRVFGDGIVAVPFNALHSYSESASCANVGGGVQLVHWANDTLTAGPLLPVPGNPRRALENGQEILAVSDSNVRAFALDATMTADLTIDTCTPDTDGYADNYPMACSAGGRPAGWLIVLAAIGFARRRRR